MINIAFLIIFFKNEDNWGYGNEDQTSEERQQEFESLELKSDTVLNLFHDDLEGKKVLEIYY